jgi:hypothetical protein
MLWSTIPLCGLPTVTSEFRSKTHIRRLCQWALDFRFDLLVE